MYYYAVEWFKTNKGVHRHKLKHIYDVSGISKQAHNQYMERRAGDEAKSRMVLNAIIEMRKMHPIMGLKKIYSNLTLDGIGRDKFIEIGIEYGLGIKIPKSYQRTTYSTKSAWFGNLTAGLPITGINQVWTSDITYFRVGDIFYYLTFILDVYSRRILGYVASPNLRAEANCHALKSAIAARGKINLHGLIHHSDRGSQYSSNDYLKILSDNKIAASMCNSVYENTHIERVNGIIKNEYLVHKSIKTLIALQKALEQAVSLYNEERPHWSLNCLTPVQYEENLINVPLMERKEIIIYSEPKKYYVQQSFLS